MSEESTERQSPQEDDRVPSRRIAVIFATGCGVTVAAIAVASLLLDHRRAVLERPRPVATLRAAPREIGMIDQTLVGQENQGADVRMAQQRALERWGWVDRDAGVARIPIARAMDLVVARQNAPAVDGGASP